MTDARDTQPYRHTFSRPWYERPDPDIVTTVQDVRAGDELQLSFQAAATLTGNGYGLLTFWIRAITSDGRFPIDNRWGTVRVPGPTQIGMSLRWPMTLAWFHGPVEVGIRGRAEDARMTLYGPLHLSANRIRV